MFVTLILIFGFLFLEHLKRASKLNCYLQPLRGLLAVTSVQTALYFYGPLLRFYPNSCNTYKINYGSVNT